MAEEHESLRLTLSCCKFCSLALSILAFASTGWLWGVVVVGNGGSVKDLDVSIVSTGRIIASGASHSIPLSSNTTIPAQILTWNQLHGLPVCDTESDIYTEWSGKYGFCTGGAFHPPSELLLANSFAVVSFVLVFVSAVLSIPKVHKLLGRCYAIPEGIDLVAIIATVSIVASVAESAWIVDLLAGTGTLPFVSSSGELVTLRVQLRYGGFFMSYIIISVAFSFSLIASIWLRCSKTTTIDPVRFPEDEKGGTLTHRRPRAVAIV